MTLSHEEANARLLDLVYGEAPPVERVALEAHVATCARCQAEMAAMGDVRALARVGLENDDVPVPARAHARILEAAAAAVGGAASSSGAASPAAATAGPAKGNEPPSRARPVAEEPSFWDRLRAKWVFPTFATVGAVAVMLLGAKVFLTPEKVLERGQQDMFPKEEAAQEQLAPPAPPPSLEQAAPVAAEEPSAAGEPSPPPEESQRKLRPQPPGEHRLSPAARARAESAGRFGGPHGSMSGALGKPGFVSDWLGGSPASRAMGGLSVAPTGGAAGGAKSADKPAAAPAASAPAEKKPAKGSLDDMLEGSLGSSSRAGSGFGYASPPSGWKAGSGAAAPASPPVQRQPTKKQVMDEGDMGASAERSPSRADSDREDEAARDEASLSKRKAAPAPKAEPASPPPAPVVANETRAKAASAPPADMKAEAKTDAKKEKDGAASYETLARRADELFAAHRWAEASTAYADLLRRFPTADVAPRWRSRLTTAQREAAPAAKPSKAAKATEAPAAASPAAE